jgi:DNA polymerase-3 subunit delta'
MSLASFPPWYGDVAREWLSNRERFAHAWLIHGLAGTGKVDFARAAAASLLCESPRGHLACGACPACVWMASGNHPDFRRIRPDAIAQEEGDEEAADGEDGDAPAIDVVARASKKAPSKEIRVEQIRAMEAWATTGTHRGGLRVVVMYPADSLNVVSANALLKILEEPPPATVFLLVSNAPDRLLPTLVSRCRRLPLPVPTPDVAMAWLATQGVDDAAARLAASGGAPMGAWRGFQAETPARPAWLGDLVDALAAGRSPDVGSMVDVLEKQPPVQWLDALQRMTVDVALIQAGAAARYYPDATPALGRIGAGAARTAIAELGRWLQKQQRIAAHPLNGKLFAHETLLRVVEAARAR